MEPLTARQAFEAALEFLLDHYERGGRDKNDLRALLNQMLSSNWEEDTPRAIRMWRRWLQAVHTVQPVQSAPRRAEQIELPPEPVERRAAPRPRTLH